MKWYVVKTKPQQENLAIQQLTAQGFETYLPRMKLRRRGVWVFIPLFPSYLFVLLDIGKMRWQAINSTRGCRYIMCMDPELPSPMPEGYVDGLKDAEENGDFIRSEEKQVYHVGDKVQLATGAFRGHIGICEISTGKRVSVLLNLLGRKVMVSLKNENILPAP